MLIKPAVRSDAETISAIYAHHVLHGTASFDDEPPSAGDWQQKIASIGQRGWPFLIAADGPRTVGHAYVTQFRDRPAYRFTCETSIYVHPSHVGQGIGRELLTDLIEAAREAGSRQMIAVIGGGEPASVALHAACGFTDAGRMKDVGFKFNRWLDTVYMQLSIVNE
jgi:phosphinothricin acetyltransferase